MIPLTEYSRVRKGQHIRFLRNNDTNENYWGRDCILMQDFAGEQEVFISYHSPSGIKFERHTNAFGSDSSCRFEIVGRSGFGQWIKERGL